MKNRLTTRGYWTNYYSSAAEDQNVIRDTCSRFDAVWNKMYSAVSHRPSSIVEIGAFPGRYLAYLAAKFQLRPTGIDFNPDREKFARTLESMGVTDFDYFIQDFLNTKPGSQFDILLSHGFIEHFEDFERVMDMHVGYVKPGGVLVVTVPNKRNLRYLYGLALDYENLKIHNLKTMHKRVFYDFAFRNGLDVVDVNYFGGFAYKVHTPLGKIKDLIYRAVMKVFRRINPILSKHPSPLWSGLLVGIFRKPPADK